MRVNREELMRLASDIDVYEEEQNQKGFKTHLSIESMLLLDLRDALNKIAELEAEVSLLKRQAQAEILKTASIIFEDGVPLHYSASICEAEHWLNTQISQAVAKATADLEFQLEKMAKENGALGYAIKSSELYHCIHDSLKNSESRKDSKRLNAIESSINRVNWNDKSWICTNGIPEIVCEVPNKKWVGWSNTHKTARAAIDEWMDKELEKRNGE